MITNDEFDKLKKLMQATMKQVIEEEGLIKKEDLKYLPTKDEFFKRMDKLSGELETIRTEHKALSGRQSKHSDQIEKLETKVKKIDRVLHLS